MVKVESAVVAELGSTDAEETMQALDNVEGLLYPWLPRMKLVVKKLECPCPCPCPRTAVDSYPVAVPSLAVNMAILCTI